MKAWMKEGRDEKRFYDGGIAAFIVMFVISVIADRSILFVPAALLLLLVVMGKVYDQYSGRELQLHHQVKTVRLFPGESTSLQLALENSSHFPMLNGKLSFQTGSSVGNIEKQTGHNGDYHYKLPLTLHGKKTVQLSLPLEAVHRGAAKIKKVSFTYPHIITFLPVRLTYQKPVQTEFLVYPELMEINGVDEFFQKRPGAHQARFSLFEDPGPPAGVRDYISGDSMDRIHWKASAKTQGLKTKVLEKQVNKELTVFINLTQQSPLGHAYPSEHLEQLLSATGSLCLKMAHFEVPYELHINLKRAHQASIFKQEYGGGVFHLRQSLELLARVDKSFPVERMSSIMYRWDQQAEKQNTMVIVGEVDPEMHVFLQKWQWEGLRIMVVETNESGAVLYEWRGRK